MGLVRSLCLEPLCRRHLALWNCDGFNLHATRDISRRPHRCDWFLDRVSVAHRLDCRGHRGLSCQPSPEHCRYLLMPSIGLRLIKPRLTTAFCHAQDSQLAPLLHFPSCPGRRSRARASSLSSCEVVVEVVPLWIDRLDQANLVQARPVFQHLLASDSCGNVVMRLGVNEALQRVPRGETLHGTCAMLPGTARQVAGDADVERPLRPVRHDVDPGAPMRGWFA